MCLLISAQLASTTSNLLLCLVWIYRIFSSIFVSLIIVNICPMHFIIDNICSQSWLENALTNPSVVAKLAKLLQTWQVMLTLTKPSVVAKLVKLWQTWQVMLENTLSEENNYTEGLRYRWQITKTKHTFSIKVYYIGKI